MEFKVDFKCSDTAMRVDLGAVTDLSESQKTVYEQKLRDSEMKAESYKTELEACKSENEALGNEIEGYERDVEGYKAEIESCKTEIEGYKAEIEALEDKADTAYNDGLEQGKRQEHDGFWDVYQRNGGRSDYSRAFAGAGWTEDTFYPKYNIAPRSSATRMFDSCYLKDIGKTLRERGITLDTSSTERTDYMFSNAKTVTVPALDIRKATINEYMFYRAESLKTIERLVISDDGSTVFGTRFFNMCYALENITFDGAIGCDLDIRHSPLTRESIDNIFWSLSTEVSGCTVYLSRANINKRYETSEGANDGASSEEWRGLWLNRPMWYYELV